LAALLIISVIASRLADGGIRAAGRQFSRWLMIIDAAAHVRALPAVTFVASRRWRGRHVGERWAPT
jgi:hypothetical protein